MKDPVYLDFQEVDERYEPDFCHVSAKHAAQRRGGRRVHGWALWQYDDPAGEALPIIVGDNDKPDLVAYCKKPGLADTSML